ncbi:MAG: phage protein U [Clostridium sp.]
MIGYFGKEIIFETSEKKTMTFNGLSIDVASRYAKHDVIMQKPKTEFLGPDLDTITFSVKLNGSFGVKPRAEMEKWALLARNGTAETFVVGGKPLGSDKWIVKSVSQAWDTIFNGGELYSGNIDVTLEEYSSKI